MSDVISAGTVVGAVLETAGYMTQHRILHDFDKFFDYAGAHLFTIAGFAGLCAIVVFGSYRMARYLLLGPFLFYILVSPRTTIDGVWWSLGNRKPVETRFLTDQALESEKKKIEAAEGTRGPIEVSRAFESYTRIVSDLVNTVVQFVLRYHSDGDYLFFGRRYALDMLVNALPQRARTLHIVYDQFVVGECSEMMNVSLALAQKSLSGYQMMHYQEMLGESCGTLDQRSVKQVIEDAKRDIRARLEAKRKKGEAVRLNDQEIEAEANQNLAVTQEQCRRVRQKIYQTIETIQYLTLEYEDLAKNRRTTIDPETAEFIVSYRNEDADKSGAAKRYNLNTIPELQALYGGDEKRATALAGQSISCGAMWEVASNAILSEAALLLHNVEKMLFGEEGQKHGVVPNVSATGKDDREILCRELVKKMGGPEAGMFEDSEVIDRINDDNSRRRARIKEADELDGDPLDRGPGGSFPRIIRGQERDVSVIRENGDGTLTIEVRDSRGVLQTETIRARVLEWLDNSADPTWDGSERWANVQVERGPNGQVNYEPTGAAGSTEVIQVRVKGRENGKLRIEGPTTYSSNGTFGRTQDIVTNATIVVWGSYTKSQSAVANVRRCDLVQATALYLLRNLVTYTPHGRAATSVKMRAGFSKDFRGIRVVAPEGDVDANGKPREDGLVVSYGDAQVRYRIDEGRTIQEIATPSYDENGQQKKDKLGRVLVEWRPFYEIESDGHMSAAYAIHQKYQTEYLRQGIFTWAMNLPYYQGCLLYFLAIAYPFMALVVVIPNKAVAFLHLPLAWLWVKSWDIGFAITMVVEKILWNNLPHARVAYDPMMQPYSEDGRIMTGIPLPDLIQTAFSSDPSYNIHAHFNYLTMILFSVPVISGYLIMKGKHAALASFVDGPQKAADDAGQIGQGRYGVTMMNEKITAMKRGEGLTLNKYRGQGRGAGGRYERALRWGAIGAASSAVSSLNDLRQSVPSKGQLTGDLNETDDGVMVGPGGNASKMGFGERALTAASLPANKRKLANGTRSAVANSSKAAVSTYYDIANAEDDFAAYYDLAYGSFKEHRKRQGAIFAAMDAFGEHEMTHFLEGRSALKKEITLFERKMKVGYDVVTGLTQDAISLASPKQGVGKHGVFETTWKSVAGAAFHAYGQQYGGQLASDWFPWHETQRERWTVDRTGNYRVIRDRDRKGYHHSLINGTTYESYEEAADRVNRSIGRIK